MYSGCLRTKAALYHLNLASTDFLFGKLNYSCLNNLVANWYFHELKRIVIFQIFKCLINSSEPVLFIWYITYTKNCKRRSLYSGKKLLITFWVICKNFYRGGIFVDSAVKNHASNTGKRFVKEALGNFKEFLFDFGQKVERSEKILDETMSKTKSSTNLQLYPSISPHAAVLSHSSRAFFQERGALLYIQIKLDFLNFWPSHNDYKKVYGTREKM